jgi:predicted ATPase
MITQLKIENYKSIQELTLDVGRVNVLIGENGCGKSNILEAITLAAAAEANKLDNEFLPSRGVRVTEPKLMRSAFDFKSNNDKPIIIEVFFKNKIEKIYKLENDNKPYSKWRYNSSVNEELNTLIKQREVMKMFTSEFEKITSFNSSNSEIQFNKEEKESFKEAQEILKETDKTLDRFERKKRYLDAIFSRFIIFFPENSALRNLAREGQVQPLGIYGEGLLKLLIVTQHEAKNSEQLNQELERFNDIQRILELIEWYEYIKIPNEYPLLEDKLIIKDRYLESEFDTKSVNEGFLFLLFYAVLTVSKYTPKIFAIDNIDTSFNPKLCAKLIEELAHLAKKYDKQIFLTSHNPAILDGIDLGDEEGQRLFVVSRNREGHTRCKRITIENKPKSSIRDRLSRVLNENENYTKQDVLALFDNSKEPVKLSEAFLRGYLGGLPKGF